MRLRHILNRLDINKLREMADFWEISLPDLRNLSEEEKQSTIIDTLYPSMESQAPFQKVFKKLEEEERELVFFLTIHGGEMSRDECLERFFDNTEKPLIKLVNTLTSKGFVFFDELKEQDLDLVVLCVPEPYLQFIDLPSHWMGFLGFFLREISLYHLRAIAHVGLKKKLESNVKSYFIFKIRHYLLDPKNLQYYLNDLPGNEGKMFRKIVEKKGVVVFRDLLDTGSQKRYDHIRADYINNLLSYSGLVFVGIPDSNKYNSLLMVPRDVMYIIQNQFKVPDTRSINELDVLSLPGKEKPPQIVLENSSNILRDLVVFTGFINRNALRVLSNGGIGKNDLKKVLPYLSRQKTVKYVSFLALFCIQKKFIVDAGGVWKVSSEFEQWLSEPRSCYTDLLKFWLTTSAWNEEYADGDTVHSEAAPENLVDIVSLRKIILEELENIPHNRWIYFKSFTDTVLPRIEINLPRRGSQMVLDKFNRPNYIVLESLMAESLYWLGIANIGVKKETDITRLGNRAQRTSRKKQKKTTTSKPREIPYFFKLTELGRFILEGPYMEPEKLFKEREDYEVLPLNFSGDHLIVQPNLEVVVPPDFRLADFYRLNKFASITNLDVMTTLTINKESVRQAMDQGMQCEEILEFFSRHSRRQLPETVEHLIKECSETHGGITMGAVGGYIKVEDPVLLAEMLSHKKLQNLIREIVGEKLILLNPDVSMKKVARELQNIGFMPRLETDSIRKSSTGEYHLSLNKEDLYNLIAILKLVAHIEKDFKSDFTEKKSISLIEQLKPLGSEAYSIDKLADSIGKSFQKNFVQAFKKQVHAKTNRYKKQLSRLMTVSVSRAPSKYSFEGPNPATKRSDIRRMFEFAVDNELRVEITYKKSPQKTVEEIIDPDSLDSNRIYGYCKNRESYCVFSLLRVKRSKLV